MKLVAWMMPEVLVGPTVLMMLRVVDIHRGGFLVGCVVVDKAQLRPILFAKYPSTFQNLEGFI